MPKLSAKRKTRKPAKRHRLEARITDEQRQLFQRAADLQGRSLTDFVISKVHEKAVQTIESMENHSAQCQREPQNGPGDLQSAQAERQTS